MRAIFGVLSTSVLFVAPTAVALSASSAGDDTGVQEQRPPSKAGPQSADEASESRARELELQIGALKDKVDQARERLKNWEGQLLLGGGTSGARLELVHRNELGNLFVLESVSYALDGARLYTKFDGDLATRETFSVFSGAVTPGQHALRVTVTYRGRGFGPVSYPDGFRVTVTSSYVFNAQGGKVTRIEIVGHDQGNLTTPFAERPGIRYDVSQTDDRPR